MVRKEEGERRNEERKTNHEEIGCFWTLSTDSEEFYEVEKLTMDVSADLREGRKAGRSASSVRVEVLSSVRAAILPSRMFWEVRSYTGEGSKIQGVLSTSS